jgi:hypothetical protein
MTVERVLVKDYWVQRGRSENNTILTWKLKFPSIKFSVLFHNIKKNVPVCWLQFAGFF